MEKQAMNQPNKKLKIAVPIIAVCATFAVATAIVVPVVIYSHNYNPAELVELTDLSILSALEGGSPNVDVDPAPPQTLDEIYEDFLVYKNQTQTIDSGSPVISFFSENKLTFEEDYVCYYLSKKTIEKIEAIEQKQQYPDSYSRFSYLRRYKWHLDEGWLKRTRNDRIMTCRTSVKNPSIKTSIGYYSLVHITRSIDISDKTFGKSFIESICYQEDGLNAVPIPNRTSVTNEMYAEKYDSRRVLVQNVPRFKSLFQFDYYPVSFLDIHNYLINEDNDTFETIMIYSLEKNEHYYDSVKEIIIEEQGAHEFIRYDSEKNEHYYRYAEVICDCKKAKALFSF